MSNIPWEKIPENAGRPILMASGVTSSLEDPDHYADAYLKEPNSLGVARRKLWMNEVLSEFDPGSSLLIFGSGHVIEANTYSRELDFSRIVAMDICGEAGIGLDEEIEFRQQNILTEDFECFDYIFSSHTIEHFTRDEVMDIILPKCLRRARKAVVFLAPYRDIGWGLPDPAGPHLINLSEEDELTACASKWKRIKDNPTLNQYGIEIVLWFEGESK